VPALIRKFHDAKLAGQDWVGIWGSGTARREFLHVDDLADACLFLMGEYNDAGHVNIGTGEDVTIRELAELVRDIVHPGASLRFDLTKPDGAPRKLLDVSKLHRLGWRHRISLTDGVVSTCQWFVDNEKEATLSMRGPVFPARRECKLNSGI
jgi:GDP-L-fucose synthase